MSLYGTEPPKLGNIIFGEATQVKKKVKPIYNDIISVNGTLNRNFLFNDSDELRYDEVFEIRTEDIDQSTISSSRLLDNTVAVFYPHSDYDKSYLVHVSFTPYNANEIFRKNCGKYILTVINS